MANPASFSSRSEFKLNLSISTTHVVGSGTRVDVYAYVTNGGTTKPYSSIATKSFSMPGATTSNFSTAATSASATWTYDFRVSSTQDVWTYTRYYPYSYGTSASMSLTAADGSGGLIGSATATTSIALYAQPSPPTQNSSPSISGSGISGTTLSVSSGSYSNGSVSSTLIAYNTSGSFSGAPGSTRSNGYTVTDGDAASPAYYFAAVDTVAGTDGSTYYYYSSAIKSGYLVSFNSNGGSSVSNGMFYSGGTVSFPSSPTRSGYTFLGWTYNGSYVSNGFSPGVNTGITLVAQWQLNAQYSITYSGNGNTSGSAPVDNNLYAAGNVTAATNSGSLARTGYTFGGWSISSGGTVSEGGTFYLSSSVTLYAIWNANSYTVTYNANGGSVSPSTFSVSYGSTYGTLATPTRSGYSFVRWYDSGGTTVTSATTYSLTSNSTITAEWSANTYTVTFDSQSGSAVSNGSFTTGGTVSQPVSPTRSGYTFAGWSTTAGGTAVTFPYAPGVAQNITLYALWTAISYTLTYDANGGTVSPTSKSISYGSIYDTLPTPTRTGYTFTGWYTATTAGTQILSSSTYSTAGNSTIYAQWTVNAYTVTWNANTGTVSPTSSNASYGSSITAPTPTKEGFSFAGWYTADTGGSFVIGAGGSYTVSASITLYAQWSILTPKVWNGTTWARSTSVKVWNGTSWVTAQMKVWNGAAWVNPL